MLYGILLRRELTEALYVIVFALHGIIVLVLLRRPNISLPVLWLLWTLVGGLLLELLFSNLFQPLWAVLAPLMPRYFGWVISLPALAFILVRWLKARQRNHPNGSLSQTYLWGSGLVVAAWLLPSLLTFMVDLFKYPENAFTVLGDVFGNLHFFLLPLLVLCGVAFLVIFIATQTFLKPPADSLPADDAGTDVPV